MEKNPKLLFFYYYFFFKKGEKVHCRTALLKILNKGAVVSKCDCIIVFLGVIVYTLVYIIRGAASWIEGSLWKDMRSRNCSHELILLR